MSDDAGRKTATAEQLEDQALLALLVHTAFADRELAEDELEFVERLLPGRDPTQLRAWVRRVAERPLDMDAIAAALPSPEARWTGLRFAVRMAMKDGHLDDTESALLDSVRKGLDLPAHALKTALHEVRMFSGLIDVERLYEAVRGYDWWSVQLVPPDGLPAALTRHAPEGAHAAFGVRLDEVDALALYDQGLVGRFQEGTRFVAWSDIVAYTRATVLSAAVVFHTEDGGRLRLIDSRLRGLAGLLDRVFHPERPEKGAPPVVEKLVTRKTVGDASGD
jgi:hypothetical protein